jgi:hypothetical protein
MARALDRSHGDSEEACTKNAPQWDIPPMPRIWQLGDRVITRARSLGHCASHAAVATLGACIHARRLPYPSIRAAR